MHQSHRCKVRHEAHTRLIRVTAPVAKPHSSQHGGLGCQVGVLVLDLPQAGASPTPCTLELPISLLEMDRLYYWTSSKDPYAGRSFERQSSEEFRIHAGASVTCADV
jgi:hypothetical protein